MHLESFGAKFQQQTKQWEFKIKIQCTNVELGVSNRKKKN